MLRLLANALLAFLQAFSLWSRARDRQAGRDAERAARAAAANRAYERERQASEAAASTDMLDLNDRLRDRADRH